MRCGKNRPKIFQKGGDPLNNQHNYQKYVFKLHSTRLRKARWNLTLTLDEAQKCGELIPLADSTALRFIDELNGTDDTTPQVSRLRSEIHKLSHSDAPNKKSRLRRLYEQLNTLLFKPDYLCLVMDTDADYDRAYKKGFTVNGIRYTRLLATTGQVKNKTIVFTSDTLKPALRKRMDNGRNPDIPYVPAKFGAYESLISSSSIAVSAPRIIVVNDCMTTFKEDVLKLDDSGGGEPILEAVPDFTVVKNASDGFGLMLPSRARIWGEELHMDTMPSGLVTRPYAFGKGLLVTFDFHEFADTVAHSYTVTDVWGDPRDIREADVILTASMLKLWEAYDSFEDYMNHCLNNHYQFCITKICTPFPESERTLNYQFLQSYAFTDEQLEALLAPTIREIHEVLGDSYAKSILFLRGTDIDEAHAEDTQFNYIKALQIEPAMAQDPYIRACIHRRIEKQINEAKIGAIKVHGNYQTACGDPYALCQSMFGLEVTGLLNTGEFYSAYWSERGISTVVCFRAPMTCHNNIRRLHFPATDAQKYWFRYIRSLVVFNAWDTATDALNGEDFDGDQNFLTDNPILLQNHRILPTIMCIQRKAEKMPITEDLLVAANKMCFGDDIGRYTNGITAQFEVQAGFPPGSPEYETLDYRIMCGQLFQQNAIDKTKGIIASPRPKYWFEASGDDISRRIAADKKPYFMRYIYPQLQKDYKAYTADAGKKCLIRFGQTLDELEQKPSKTEDEQTFLDYYHARMPVGMRPCVINRICRRLEQEFDGYLSHFTKESDFSPELLKSGKTYPDTCRKVRSALEKLYDDYCAQVKTFQRQAKSERQNAEDTAAHRAALLTYFRQQSALLCPDPLMLADILIDLCYTTTNSKQFVWDICGDTIIENLLAKNHGRIKYPEQADGGDIHYLGKTFILREKYIGLSIDDPADL